MDKYVCPCGYVYDPAVGDPDHGVAPGTPWEQIPEDWECPICGMGIIAAAMIWAMPLDINMPMIIPIIM